jgi:predicted nucleic acid-binding protein
MIAADTSTWVAFLEGGDGEDVKLLDQALEQRQVVMIPVVLTELLSDPGLLLDASKTLLEIPLVDIEAGFWQRAGALRAQVLAKRRRARLADALIAQTCLEGGLALITRDRDFRVFAEAAGLGLVIRT